MKLQTLLDDFNKVSSLEYLESQNVNTPRFSVYTDKDSFRNVCIRDGGKKVSIRTYKKDIFKSPHYPNVVLSSEIMDRCKSHIGEGYQIIISDPIDPKEALYKGNLEYQDRHNFLIEYTPGPGTVRDTDNGSKNSIVQLSSRVEIVDKLERYGANILYTAYEIFWGHPIILEWSIYLNPVGKLKDQLIFWEIRPVKN